MNTNCKKEKNLQGYFNNAKNQDLLFTHKKLRSIVESASLDRSNVDVLSSSTTMSKRMIMSIILTGTVLGTLLWFQLSPDSETFEQEYSITTANIAPSVIPIQSNVIPSHAPASYNGQMTANATAQSSLVSIKEQHRKPVIISTSESASVATKETNTDSPMTLENTVGKSLSQKEATSDIEGITPVTISPEEANFLGISVKDCDISLVEGKNTFTFAHNDTDDKTIEKNDWGAGVSFEKHTTSHNIPFNPWIVTTERGSTKLASLDDERIKKIGSNAEAMQAEIINRYVSMNKFIGVRVQSGCPNFSMTFWYEPTLELIRQLPTRYYSVLKDELDRANGGNTSSLKDSDNPTNDSPQTGCRYMDACRTTSGAVTESSVYPNPASERMILRFTLSEPRVCSISLHYLNGMFIEQISNQVSYAVGEHTINQLLSNKEAGMYLLSMVTDKGERIVQRIVLSK